MVNEKIRFLFSFLVLLLFWFLQKQIIGIIWRQAIRLIDHKWCGENRKYTHTQRKSIERNENSPKNIREANKSERVKEKYDPDDSTDGGNEQKHLFRNDLLFFLVHISDWRAHALAHKYYANVVSP